MVQHTSYAGVGLNDVPPPLLPWIAGIRTGDDKSDHGTHKVTHGEDQNVQPIVNLLTLASLSVCHRPLQLLSLTVGMHVMYATTYCCCWNEWQQHTSKQGCQGLGCNVWHYTELERHNSVEHASACQDQQLV